MENQKSYYAIIPANVRYSNITPNAKLLYGEITALCNDKGYCWASNKYFADLYNVSTTSISLWVKSLEEEGFIKSEVFENNTRHIFLGGVLRNHKGGFKKSQRGVLRKLKHNNTTNTTIKREAPALISEPVKDKYETKKEFAKRKNLPYTPRKKTPLQQKAFKKQIEAQPIIDYFKEKGQEIHGMQFLYGSESRNKQVRGQINNVIGMIGDYKGLIDWWFLEDHSFFDYEPEALFKEKIIERFKNSKKVETKKAYFKGNEMSKDLKKVCVQGEWKFFAGDKSEIEYK